MDDKKEISPELLAQAKKVAKPLLRAIQEASGQLPNKNDTSTKNKEQQEH